MISDQQLRTGCLVSSLRRDSVYLHEAGVQSHPFPPALLHHAPAHRQSLVLDLYRQATLGQVLPP